MKQLERTKLQVEIMKALINLFEDDYDIKVFLSAYSPHAYMFSIGKDINAYMDGALGNVNPLALKRIARKLEIDGYEVKVSRPKPETKALPAPQKKLPKPTKAALKKFLKHEFEIPNLKTLPIDSKVAPIIKNRFDEARRALEDGKYLYVFLLCGSILEAVLLGLAEKNPELFNDVASPKKKNNGDEIEQFSRWGLSDFIKAAVKIGFITDDTKMLGDFLRYCRNYIHPYKEVSSNHEPNKETAELCFQYLQLAVVSIAKETNNDKKAKNN